MAETGFTVDSLQTVRDRTVADIDSSVQGADSRLRKTALRALSVALAGASWALRKFGYNITKEILPDCASDVGVRRWRKSILGLPDIQPAAATGLLNIVGTPAATLAAGSELVRNDGVAVTTNALTTIPGGGNIDAAVTAVLTGTAGNALIGQIHTLTVPSAGITSTALVADDGSGAGLTGGISDEAVESERSRTLARLSDPPQGGSDADYRAWVVLAVPTTREVFISPNVPNVGHVTIRFIIEPSDGDPVNAIPSAGQITAVDELIGGTVAASYTDALSPVPVTNEDNRIDTRTMATQAISLEITALLPNNAATKLAVEASIRAMMLNDGVPGGTLRPSQFTGAIDAASGEISHALTKINGIAPADVAIGADSFPSLTLPITYV